MGETGGPGGRPSRRRPRPGRSVGARSRPSPTDGVGKWLAWLPTAQLLDGGAGRGIEAEQRAPADGPDEAAGTDRRAVRAARRSSRAPRRTAGTRSSARPGVHPRTGRRPRCRPRRRHRRRWPRGRRRSWRCPCRCSRRGSTGQQVAHLVLADLQHGAVGEQGRRRRAEILVVRVHEGPVARCEVLGAGQTRRELEDRVAEVVGIEDDPFPVATQMLPAPSTSGAAPPIHTAPSFPTGTAW